MGKKHKELIELYKSNGWYIADIYDNLGGYFYTRRYLYFSKKEVVRELRNEEGVICPREIIG